MADWKPGDIAVALINGKKSALTKGKKYTVLEVRNDYNGWDNKGTGPGLVVLGAKHSENIAGQFWHGNFDKLPFHESDEFDKETIELYNKTPVKETT